MRARERAQQAAAAQENALRRVISHVVGETTRSPSEYGGRPGPPALPVLKDDFATYSERGIIARMERKVLRLADLLLVSSCHAIAHIDGTRQGRQARQPCRSAEEELEWTVSISSGCIIVN